MGKENQDRFPLFRLAANIGKPIAIATFLAAMAYSMEFGIIATGAAAVLGVISGACLVIRKNNDDSGYEGKLDKWGMATS